MSCQLYVINLRSYLDVEVNTILYYIITTLVWRSLYFMIEWIWMSREWLPIQKKDTSLCTSYCCLIGMILETYAWGGECYIDSLGNPKFKDHLSHELLFLSHMSSYMNCQWCVLNMRPHQDLEVTISLYYIIPY